MAKTPQPPGEVVPLYERLGAQVAAARKERGLTQRQLGELIGEAQTTVSDYEAGKVSYDLGTLFRIEHALDVSGGTLLFNAEIIDVAAAATSEAIRNDPRLDEGFRKLVLDFYRFAVKRSDTARPTDPEVDPRRFDLTDALMEAARRDPSVMLKVERLLTPPTDRAMTASEKAAKEHFAEIHKALDDATAPTTKEPSEPER